MIGRTLSHYKILSLLGKGGMGEVYLAEDTRLERLIALKVLPAEFASNAERLERFTREAKTLAAVNHPAIVTIFSVEEEEGVHFLTMEKVEGTTLDEKIPKLGMPLEQFLATAIPIAGALAAAHDKGITHRDLKPANVMVSTEGRIKVLDFGLARQRQPETEAFNSELATAAMTTQGHVLGTIAYMSPEQAEGKSVDPRSDVFSLGVLLFEMATGRRPFGGDTNISILSSILQTEAPSVLEAKPELPRQLGRILGRCLEKDPKMRFQSARGLRAELGALRAERGLGRTVPGLPFRWAGRPRWMTVAGGVLLVSSLALVGYFVAGRSEPASPAPPGVTLPRPPANDGRRMIAVLPFKNLGPPEDEYFAEGITEEITGRLAMVSGLGVISRGSAAQYAGIEKNTRAIGSELGVDYLLRGSIRWSARLGEESRVRVTPRLIRVSDDTQFWSPVYDRVIEDIFSVQSEIATAVADELGVTLLQPERGSIAAEPTQNIDAYQAFLRGQSYKSQPLSEETQLMAAQMLELAVEADPEFTLAWASLTHVHGLINFNAWDPGGNHLEKARAALERAQALDPDSPAVWIAAGYFHYYGLAQYDRAAQEFERVAKALPNDTSVLVPLALVHRRQGRVEEAVREFLQAQQLDPLNSKLLDHIAETYQASRSYRQADDYWRRAIAVAPDQELLYVRRAENLVRWRGATAGARALLEEAPGRPSLVQWDRLDFLDLDYLDRDLKRVRIELSSEPSLKRVKGFLLAGMVQRLSGETVAEQTSFEAAEREAAALIKASPDASILHSALALAQAFLGRREQAIHAATTAAEMDPTDAYSRPLRQENLAQVYAWVGNEERAVDLLAELLQRSYQRALSVPMLKIDPIWDPLRDNSRFQELVGAD